MSSSTRRRVGSRPSGVIEDTNPWAPVSSDAHGVKNKQIRKCEFDGSAERKCISDECSISKEDLREIGDDCATLVGGTRTSPLLRGRRAGEMVGAQWRTRPALEGGETTR
jgi:hypothetical protein